MITNEVRNEETSQFIEPLTAIEEIQSRMVEQGKFRKTFCLYIFRLLEVLSENVENRFTSPLHYPAALDMNCKLI